MRRKQLGSLNDPMDGRSPQTSNAQSDFMREGKTLYGVEPLRFVGLLLQVAFPD